MSPSYQEQVKNQRILKQEQQQKNKKIQSEFSKKYHNLPFWIWNKVEHAKRYDECGAPFCCFQHSIGLPKKGNHSYPLFDYQRLIFDAFENHKFVYLLKATGIGATTFTLRYLAWKCLKDDQLRGSTIVILTGPRIQLSIDLISRLKGLFSNFDFAQKETEVTLNGTDIRAYPSHHLASARGIENVSFVFCDEADYWNPSEQDEARVVAERYAGKSNASVFLVSTPGQAGGLFQHIQQEETSMYYRLYLDWRYAVGRIFTEQDIQRARLSPSWEREYNLRFTGGQASAFSHLLIDKAIQNGRQRQEVDRKYYNVEIRTDVGYGKSLGIDVGFGSSKFAFCLTQLRGDRRTGLDGKIDVLFCQEYERPDWNQMIRLAADIILRYGNVHCYVDSSSPEVIAGIKQAIGERTDYREQLAKLKKNKSNPALYMKVLPVSFSKGGVAMLNRVKILLDRGLISINPCFDKLILALQTCKEENGHVLKEQMQHDDIFDSFRLSLRNYQDYDPTTNKPITAGNDWSDVY